MKDYFNFCFSELELFMLKDAIDIMDTLIKTCSLTLDERTAWSFIRKELEEAQKRSTASTNKSSLPMSTLMQGCKKCGCGNFSGKMVHVKRLFPNEDKISYSRWVVYCSNGHLIGAFDKPQKLAELKTHHTTE